MADRSKLERRKGKGTRLGAESRNTTRSSGVGGYTTNRQHKRSHTFVPLLVIGSRVLLLLLLARGRRLVGSLALVGGQGIGRSGLVLLGEIEVRLLLGVRERLPLGSEELAELT